MKSSVATFDFQLQLFGRLSFYSLKMLLLEISITKKLHVILFSQQNKKLGKIKVVF